MRSTGSWVLVMVLIFAGFDPVMCACGQMKCTNLASGCDLCKRHKEYITCMKENVIENSDCHITTRELWTVAIAEMERELEDMKC